MTAEHINDVRDRSGRVVHVVYGPPFSINPNDIYIDLGDDDTNVDPEKLPIEPDLTEESEIISKAADATARRDEEDYGVFLGENPNPRAVEEPKST